MEADSGILNKNMLIYPSVATGEWTAEQVWNTGFIKDLWWFLNRSGRRTVSCTHSISLYQTLLILLPSVIPTTTVQPNSLLLPTLPLLILKLSSHPTQPTSRQLTSSNPTSTVHRSLKRLANLFTCLKPIQLRVVVLREYRVRMELRFGELIMECNLLMGILRLGFILVDKIRFIMSVFFLKLELYSSWFFFPRRLQPFTGEYP